ncbi:MAG: hypothetical protein P4K83_07440 [Terracidiphilus sp.]|nr:hypothetical protein [Terracidiphilus sp.]
MYTIAESKLLLRAHIELPADLRLRTADFQEEWNFVQNASAQQLSRKTHKLGWSLVLGLKGLRGSGVGDTSQLAIAGALKLALRNVAAQWNAAEVRQIALTQYPWFYLARLFVYPYRIQHTPLIPDHYSARPLPVTSRRNSPSPRASELRLGCPMSQLKQMLVLSGDSEASAL